jgi:tetratricopeptide (TPR) repeat protein
MSDFPVVSAEMDEVYKDAVEAGDRGVQSRALAAIAEVTLLRSADVGEAERIARRALEVADEDESRITALDILETTAWWRGRLTESEALAEERLEIARRLGRQDIESDALLSLAGIHTSRRAAEQSEPLIARALELAEESGSLTAKARAFNQSGELNVFLGRDDEAMTDFERARDLYLEVGAASDVARVLMRIGWLVRKREGVAEAEKLFRESIRILKPLEDRGTLCEVQRSLAEALLEQGKVDEAEAWALRALETVGPQDASSQASTRKTLALVRAAQGRDDEAEALFRESIEILERSEYTRFLSEPLRAIIQFFEERERADDLVAFRARLAELRAGNVPEESAATIA